MNNLSAPLVAVLLCLAGNAASAEQRVTALPGTDIGAACLDGKNATSNEICYAFVLGVIQSHQTLRSEHGIKPAFCLPEALSRTDVLKAIKKHFRRAIDESHKPADRFVVDALAASFTCAKQD